MRDVRRLLEHSITVHEEGLSMMHDSDTGAKI